MCGMNAFSIYEPFIFGMFIIMLPSYGVYKCYSYVKTKLGFGKNDQYQSSIKNGC